MNKILVVDDDLDILGLLDITLSMYNYNVSVTADWRKIESSIVNFKPDIILLDVTLGGADGRDICKKIKEDVSTRHIPVVLFSANVEVEKNIAGYQANGFIAKPYELPYLLETLKSALGQSI